MGGFDASVCFELKEHSCPRTNELIQKDRDAFINIIQTFSLPQTDHLQTLVKRLEKAIQSLYSLQFWQDYVPTEAIDLEESFKKTEPFYKEDDQACPGCWSARFFYATAPFMTLQALSEAFEIPMRVKQSDEDSQLCDRALQVLAKETQVALNIGQHAEEILEKVFTKA